MQKELELVKMFLLLNSLVLFRINYYFFPLSGLGDSEYISITEIIFREKLLEAFLRAGFASRVKEYEVSPCPRGTFVDASISDRSKLQCLKCPAGKSHDWFVLYDTQNHHFQKREGAIAKIVSMMMTMLLIMKTMTITVTMIMFDEVFRGIDLLSHSCMH